MVRTVYTAVDAVIGQVQRREHDDPVAVECQLDLLRQPEDFLVLFRNLTEQKHRCLPVGQTLAVNAVCGFLWPGFFQQPVNQRCIVFMLFRPLQALQNLLMVDKFFCF